MSNNWSNFEIQDKELPEDIVVKKIDGFSKATRQLAEMNVTSSESFRTRSKLRSDFAFKVYLTSPVLSDYRFVVFQFGYDIKMDKVRYVPDQAISEEFGHYANVGPSDCELEEFEDEVQKIFDTKAFSELVSGLMTIAQREANKMGI